MHSLTSIARAAGLSATVALAAPLAAQSRLAIPAGTVILVRTNSALDSRTATVGQTFETTVEQDIVIDDYTVLPSGSRIGGTVAMARAATRAQSGVIDVHFDRLTFADGTTASITGKLTSTDSAERRQINADPNAHVVLVGGRGGIGAAIAGAGSSQNTNSIMSALGSLLSQGADVAVAANTQFAVELEKSVNLRGRNRVTAGNPSALYTAPDRVRAAQQALAQRNYYRGTANGTLDNTTRRALFAFQIDNGMTGTGNLDGRTARLLGLSLTGTTGSTISADESSALRRDAQNLLTRYRSSIGIDNSGRATVGRAYSEAQLEALFALSAFADNASVYEQLVRAGGNSDASVRAGRALMTATRRVDVALAVANVAGVDVRSSWATLRARLTALEAANPM